MGRSGGSDDHAVNKSARLKIQVRGQWLMTILDPLTGRLIKIQSPIKPDLSGPKGWETIGTRAVFTRGLSCRPLTP